MKEGKLLKIDVLETDLYRIQDPIPARLIPGFDRKGGTIRFHQILSIDSKMSFLTRRTHWGAWLKTALAYEGDNQRAQGDREFAATLLKRIRALLNGKADPLWDKETRERIYIDMEPRPKEARAKRFIELLKTVDGIFLQRFTACFEERWDWDRFDRYTVSNIWSLIGDEFVDGDITAEAAEMTTTWSALKKFRKAYKQVSNEREAWEDDKGKYESIILHIEEVAAGHKFLSFLVPVVRTLLFDRPRSEHIALYRDAQMSQTRGTGTPPLAVVLQSKIKFIKTVTSPAETFSATQGRLIVTSIMSLMDEVPDHVFTGVQGWAKVAVTTSACLENTREEGGTVEFIRLMIQFGMREGPCKVIDLETGEFIEHKLLSGCTPGEYIFWMCLDYVLSNDLECMREAFLLMIKEPGKARTVTKAHGALKIVLDFVGRIASIPIAKAFASSRSGMKQSNQAWNFFKDIFTDLEEEIFRVERHGYTVLNDRTIEDIVYRKMWMSSTDFVTATDFAEHELGRNVAELWMRKCGIPKVLRRVVTQTSYKPRRIQFTAKGPLAGYGRVVDAENSINEITLVRGILMGDPVTKPVLHLINMGVRRTAQLLGNTQVLRKMKFTNPLSMIEAIRKPATVLGPVTAPTIN
jgi:hypothetical protein